jgi:hypothetical protein
MQSEPSAVNASPARGTVSGLGVCDALRVELLSFQLPWLIDELEEMRGPLEEELQRARAAASSATGDADDDEGARQYELRLLRVMRGQLPGKRVDGSVVFVGPSDMVVEAVRGAAGNVVHALVELMHDRAHSDEAGCQRLRVTAAAAVAWVETLADCRAVTAFSLDADGDASTPR